MIQKSTDLHGKHHHGVSRNETGGKAVDPNASFKETRQNTKTHIYKRNIVTENTSMETKEKQQWNYTSFTATRNFLFCSFSFDKNSLQETRKKLAELQQQFAHLFYVASIPIQILTAFQHNSAIICYTGSMF